MIVDLMNCNGVILFILSCRYPYAWLVSSITYGYNAFLTLMIN